MSFQTTHTPLEGVVEIEPTIYGDDRGYFLESYKREEFELANIHAVFVQDNRSFSRKGVIRGLHFQAPPNEQGKLVSAITGKIFDVAVDIRPNSPTFSRWYGTTLSEENARMLWIPAGFAHGFAAIEDSHVMYKVTSKYDKESESGIKWNDTKINIVWPFFNPIISKKDLQLPYLVNLFSSRRRVVK